MAIMDTVIAVEIVKTFGKPLGNAIMANSQLKATTNPQLRTENSFKAGGF